MQRISDILPYPAHNNFLAKRVPSTSDVDAQPSRVIIQQRPPDGLLHVDSIDFWVRHISVSRYDICTIYERLPSKLL
jgi:hypothetical protein